MHLIVGQVFLLAFLIAGALASENGMNMTMDTGATMTVGNMIMYLHFELGDALWFLGWVPSSAGAMVGACVGLFMLAMTERWLAAMGGVMEAHWHTRAQIALANKLNTSVVATSAGDRTKPLPKAALPRGLDLTPPFIVTHDIPRGIMQVALASIRFLLMLAVMTYQLGYIIATVIGLGVGEAFFGRYSLHFGPSQGLHR